MATFVPYQVPPRIETSAILGQRSNTTSPVHQRSNTTSHHDYSNTFNQDHDAEIYSILKGSPRTRDRRDSAVKRKVVFSDAQQRSFNDLQRIMNSHLAPVAPPSVANARYGDQSIRTDMQSDYSYYSENASPLTNVSAQGRRSSLKPVNNDPAVPLISTDGIDSPSTIASSSEQPSPRVSKISEHMNRGSLMFNSVKQNIKSRYVGHYWSKQEIIESKKSPRNSMTPGDLDIVDDAASPTYSAQMQEDWKAESHRQDTDIPPLFCHAEQVMHGAHPGGHVQSTGVQQFIGPAGTSAKTEIPLLPTVANQRSNVDVKGFDHPYCQSHCVTCDPASHQKHPGEVIRYRENTDGPWQRVVNLNAPPTDLKCPCGKPALCDCTTCRRLILMSLHPQHDYRTTDDKIENNKITQKIGILYAKTADKMSKVIETVGVLPMHRKRKRRKHLNYLAYKESIMTNPPTNYVGEHPHCKAVELGLKPKGYDCIACKNCTPCC